jgi:hypothetical protein
LGANTHSRCERAIFEVKRTKESVTIAIRAWIKEVKGSGLERSDKFLGTIENWMDSTYTALRHFAH